MPTYQVHFSRIAEIGVRVTADDPDTALDLAYDELPSELCAQCGGWNQDWWRDESNDIEFETSTDAGGKTVRSSGERWARVPE